MNAKSLLLGVAAMMVNFRLLFVVDGSNRPRISSHGLPTVRASPVMVRDF